MIDLIDGTTGKPAFRGMAKEVMRDDAKSQKIRKTIDPEQKIRDLIEAELPVEPGKARRYGIEIGLWDTRSRNRLWSGRTHGYSLEKLKKGSGDIVQAVMSSMEDRGLL